MLSKYLLKCPESRLLAPCPITLRVCMRPWASLPRSSPHQHFPGFQPPSQWLLSPPILEHSLVFPLILFPAHKPSALPYFFVPFWWKKKASKHTKFLAFFFLSPVSTCTCDPMQSEKAPSGRTGCARAGRVMCGPAVIHCIHARPTCSHFTLLPVLCEFLTEQQMPISVG